MKLTIATLPLLFLIGCKHGTETETKIHPSVAQMWQAYTKAHPATITEQQPESWFFHNNKEDADRLARLVVNEKKQAASGLYLSYKEAGAALPEVGTKHIITNFNGAAQAIIQIKKVDTIPFNQISKEYAALDMGTTIHPLEKWKKAHWEFFSGAMKENGQQPTEEMHIVCERFEKIWPVK